MSDIYKQRQHEVEKELVHIEMLNNIIPAFEDYTKEVDEFIDRIIKSDIEQLNEKDKEIERLQQCIKDDKENADEIISEQAKEIERLKKENKRLQLEAQKYYDKMIDQQQEIERLDKENTILKQTMCNNSLLINENALLNSIIKEVREYIEDKYDYLLGDDTFLDHDERIDSKRIKHILEILDKVEKVGEE